MSYTFLRTTNWSELVDSYTTISRNEAVKMLRTKLSIPTRKELANVAYSILSSIPLHYTNDGKVSTTLMLKNMPDKVETKFYNFSKDEFRGFFQFITGVAPSSWMLTSQTKDSRFCRLVPVVMAAFKIEKGVAFEDWDFNDGNLKHFTGSTLYNIIKYRSTDFSNIDKLALRESMKLKSATSWPRALYINVGEECLKANNPIPIMLAQVWAANVAYRQPYMVLDPNNWDAIPDPLDATTEEVVKKDKIVNDIWDAPF